MRGGFGRKALAIMAFCRLSLDDAARPSEFAVICDTFTAKAVRLKMRELSDRGYIERNRHLLNATLTPRGQQALESQPYV